MFYLILFQIKLKIIIIFIIPKLLYIIININAVEECSLETIKIHSKSSIRCKLIFNYKRVKVYNKMPKNLQKQ